MENLLVLREVIDVVLSGVVCAADSDDRHTGSQPRLSEAQQERTLYYTSYEERHENRYHVAGLHRYLYNLITYHITHTHTHTHPFNGPLSRTTWVSQYQKGKTNLDFTEAKRQRVAVASAGPYASLHLAPDR